MSRLRHLHRDREGAALLEFALVAPVLLLMLLGMFDMGYNYYVQSQLQGFDHLDAPVLRVCNEDVPLPYAANLEKMALIDAARIVEAAKKVCYV